MGDFIDHLDWAISLGCPPSALTTGIRKLLSNGALGILINELSEVLNTSSFVLESRKNVTLYRFRNGGNDTTIQHMKNVTRLRNEKSQMLKREKTKQYFRQAWKHLLEAKSYELHTQVEDCKRMIHICQHLMPTTEMDLTVTFMIDDLLTSVNSLYHGANKKKVVHKIWEAVYRTDMCKLWNAILQTQTQSMEKLEALRGQALHSTNISRANFDLQIGNICGKRVIAISKQCLYNTRVKNREQLIMQYINNIEEHVNYPDETGDWIALILEIQKLKVKLLQVKNEIDNKTILQDHSVSTSELTEMVSTIQRIDIRTDERIRDIKESLDLLKMSALHIHKAETDSFGVIFHLAALRNGNQQSWRIINLRSELNSFDDSFDIRAQRKIKVIGDVMGYRHTINSIDKALIFIDWHCIKTILHFSLTITPIYYLLCCYKTLALNLWLKQWMPRFTEEINASLGKYMTMSGVYCIENNIKEATNAIDLTNAEFFHEVKQYHLILDTWVHQDVLEEFIFEGTMVNGTTLKEWLRRYKIIQHLMQRPV
ncbi:uncharacterized protein LOC107267132 isoform X2 [Cephus cinctus]|uniref:Uncharacterized protein LOC107267132 isoform X2 n=1 Tax=Cephus cinctus TaxID=211228 RepID=A0AAJ7RGM4_CEPCN|nr:uncharacterized protein LOC107267132 isoform X2 [Cephus cinctus]